MPVIKRKWITRADLRAHPDWLYLFGDNLRRRGLGGQAREMRGEPNALGIATKKDCTMAPADFFTDGELGMNIWRINLDLARAFDHVENGGTVVIPADGLGTGLSELPQRAPRTNAYLVARLEELESI